MNKKLPVFRSVVPPIEFENPSMSHYIENIDKFREFLDTMFEFTKEVIENRYSTYPDRGEIFAYITLPKLVQPFPLSLPKEGFTKALESCKENYEDLEDYEKCSEIIYLQQQLSILEKN